MTADLQTPLDNKEDDFVLALLEYGGNVALAYKAAYGEDALYPVANGRRLLSRPNVLARLIELQSVQTDTALLSLSAHLIELANIRDLSKTLNNPKVALEAERSRGEVMGFYNKLAANEDTGLAKIEAVRATLRAAMAAT